MPFTVLLIVFFLISVVGGVVLSTLLIGWGAWSVHRDDLATSLVLAHVTNQQHDHNNHNNWENDRNNDSGGFIIKFRSFCRDFGTLDTCVGYCDSTELLDVDCTGETCQTHRHGGFTESE